ncbi:MAG: hypothetical protein ACE5KE_03075 [Methanosarcinales archaeon]
MFTHQICLDPSISSLNVKKASEMSYFHNLIILWTDDYAIRRYGKKVYAASRQHDNSIGARVWCNVLVDCIVTNKKRGYIAILIFIFQENILRGMLYGLVRKLISKPS